MFACTIVEMSKIDIIVACHKLNAKKRCKAYQKNKEDFLLKELIKVEVQKCLTLTLLEKFNILNGCLM